MYNNSFSNQDYFLAQIDELTKDNNLTIIERNSAINYCFIGMIFDIAGKCKSYLPTRKRLQANGKDIKPIDDVLAILGSMLKSALTMWKQYGADYKALGSILNANPITVEGILVNGNDDEPFTDLILYYGLAKEHYPEIEFALAKSFNISTQNDCGCLKKDLYDIVQFLEQEYEEELSI